MNPPEQPTAPPAQGAAQDAVAAFACLVAAVVAAGYALSRRDWPDPLPLAPFGILGMAWSLLLLPSAIGARMQATAKSSAAWFWTQPALAVASLVALSLAGRALPSAQPLASIGLAVAGAAVAGMHLARMRRAPGGLRAHWPLLPLAVAVGLWTAGHSWGSGYQSPLLLEQLATGHAHIDPLYHLALAQMIDVHGVVSTGLDGLPHTAYHFGSHWLFGGLARAAGVDLPTWYALGFAVVVVPWVLQQLLGLSLDLWRRAGCDPLPLASGRAWGAWLLWLTALAGVFVPDFSHRAWVGANLVISESYAVGTGLSLALGRMALHVWQGWQARDAVGVRSWLWFALPAATVATAVTKVSHCALLLGLAGLFWLRMGLWRHAATWASLGLCGLCAAAVAAYTTPKGLSQGLLPFAFVWQDVMRQTWTADSLLALAAFALLHPLWLWVYLAWRWWQPAGLRAAGVLASLRAGSAIDVEVLVVFAALAVLPGLVLPVQGGGAYYFSDAQRWLGIALVVGAWPQAQRLLAEVRKGALARVILAVAAALLVASFAYRTGRGIGWWQDSVAQTRARWHAGEGRKGWATVTALLDLSRLPPEVRRKAALFVPRDDRGYWDLLPDKAVPFVGPALSGLAHVGGMPVGDYTQQSYGYAAYGTGRPRVADADQARRRAEALGFTQLLVLRNGRTQTAGRTSMTTGSTGAPGAPR